MGPANGDGLEVLGPHHGADAGTPGGTVHVVDDTGELDALFAGHADGGDADQWITVFFLDTFLGIPDRGPPKAFGVQQLGLAVANEQVNRFLGAAFENDHVVAGILHLVAKKAAGIGTRDGARQRPLGNHRITPGGRCRRSGKRTGRHDHLVLRRQRIDLGVGLLDQVLGPQASLAQILVCPFHVQGLVGAGALG